MAAANALPKTLVRRIGADRIAERIEALGREIARAIRPSERPVAVVVLQGAFVFAADLLRRLPPRLNLEMGFLRCESYGAGTKSKGRVMLLQDLDPSLDLRGRTVLLIDDIHDTGLTVEYLVARLKKRGAKRILVCVLLERKKPPRARRLKADFRGFAAGPDFFVGYGLDHAGRHRNLPCLAALKPARTPKRSAKR